MSEYDIKKYLGSLYRALAVIDKPVEMRDFLGSMISSSEKVMFARRIQIAERLLAGQTHVNIIADLGVGNSTIMFVEKGLTRMFYKKKDCKKKIHSKSENISSQNEPFTFDELKKKYPAHFLLFGDLWKNIQDQ